MTFDGLRGVKDPAHPELGGNVHHGDPFSFAPATWTYLVRRFSITSVMDVGCGEGHASAYFSRVLGCTAVAVDGLERNLDSCVYPIVIHDLQRGPLVAKVDLVYCVEVVEHIEEQFLDNLLTTLCCGNLLLMTHALPGQGGHHHVNCQDGEYWISHLRGRGFGHIVEETRRIRALAGQEGASYLRESGLVFGRL